MSIDQYMDMNQHFHNTMITTRLVKIDVVRVQVFRAQDIYSARTK